MRGIGLAIVIAAIGSVGALPSAAQGDPPGGLALREGAGVQTVTPQQLLREILRGTAPLILDVRPERRYAEGHIPGAFNIPHKQVPGRWDELAPHFEHGIVVYCKAGLRTRSAVRALSVEGARTIGSLEGFFDAWEKLGYPVATPEP